MRISKRSNGRTNLGFGMKCNNAYFDTVHKTPDALEPLEIVKNGLTRQNKDLKTDPGDSQLTKESNTRPSRKIFLKNHK